MIDAISVVYLRLTFQLEHLYQVISEDESELMNKGVFPGDDLPRFWLGFYQPADFGTVQPFDTFGAAETVQGEAHDMRTNGYI